MPHITALALTTPSWVAQVRGTVTVTDAECRCGRSHFSRPSQVRISWEMVSTPSSYVTSSGSPVTLATSTEGVPSVASTATDPPMSLTRSPVTSSKSRLVGASMVQCAIPPVLPVRYPSLLTIYLILISHPRKVKTYRERNPPRPPGPPRQRSHAHLPAPISTRAN